MKRLIISSLFLAAALQAQDRVPVILELFTSEGCSSCPPADSLLAELQRTQPISNVDVIVLSEHVDYWNQLGWRDPFSNRLFSDRQNFYAGLSASNDVYTPEAVIDGHYTAVGSNRQSVVKALKDAGEKPKAALQLSVKRQGDLLVVDLPDAPKNAVWIAVTQTKAVSRVEHGENSGRTLQHVGVVRSLTKAKAGETGISISKDWGTELGVVAFVQDAHTGRISQIAQTKL